MLIPFATSFLCRRLVYSPYSLLEFSTFGEHLFYFLSSNEEVIIYLNIFVKQL